MLNLDGKEIDHQLGSRANQLLAGRWNACVAITLAGTLAAALWDWFAHPAQSVPLGKVLIVQLLLMLVFWVAVRAARLQRHAFTLALGAVSVLCLTTGLSGFLRANTIQTLGFLLVICMGAGTLLPWGLRRQLVIVVVAGAVGLATANALGVQEATSLRDALSGLYTCYPITLGFLLSLYVAYELERHRRQTEVRDFDVRWRSTALESVANGVVIANRDGRVLWVNPALTRLTGYSADEVIGQTPRLFRSGAQGTPFYRQLWDTILGGKVWHGELINRRKDGGLYTEEMTITPVCDAHGEVTRFIAVKQDITRRRQVEEAVQRSEAHFRSLVEHGSDLITILDGAGVERYHSPSYARVTGYAPEELNGTMGLERLHPQDRERVVAAFTQGLNAREIVGPIEFRTRHKDGTWRTVEVIGTNLLNDPAVAGIVLNGRDITERKRVEEALRDSEAYLKALFEQAPDSYHLHDLDGRFIDGNRAAERLIGYPKEELLGKSFLDLNLLPPDQLPKAAALLASSRQNLPTGPDELVLNRRDGSQVTVEIRTFPLHINGQTVVLNNTRDVTERKRLEAQLREAKEAAEAASRAKSEFVANMSHEIRTPMNGIIGMTELALQTELSAEQREYLQMVAASGEALMAVINDVLDFSKIEAGRLDLDAVAFDVRDTVGDAIRPLAVRAHLKHLEVAYDVRPDVPQVLVGDPHRLQQTLVNLIGNAIKFTELGEVVLLVERIAEDGTAVCLHFAVRDTGVGIPAEQQQTIFRAFSQADSSTTRRYGGSGLGLTISQRLVEMMGGRIWVESEVGRGSTFHFTVRCPAASQPPARHTPPPTELQGRLVLVVDDNATNRRILNGMLVRWEMRPTTAASGAAALGCMVRAAAAGTPFPLVIIDAHMPEMDGFELAARIKRAPELARATIMMVSSADLTGEAARCRKLGVASFLTKPIRQSELLDAILLALGSAASAEPQPTVSAAPTEPSHRCLRVLLAEDNTVNQRLAARLLEKQGHAVTAVSNGREALAACEKEVFDVILMDVQMPEMDGFEATAAIREAERTTGAHVPIIAMTAHALKGDEERCLAAGMDGYIAKPIQAKALVAAIQPAAAA